MKALAYTHAHPLDAFSIQLMDVPDPVPSGRDLLIEVRAIGLNPVDYKVRSNRSGADGKPVILGWDAAGVVRSCGSDVRRFKAGDEVFYSGDLRRPGSYAELQVVDERIVALKPKTLTFTEAAALPLTSLTAFEMLFEKFSLAARDKRSILIIGGAGGVGSQAVQLLKLKTDMTVVATASRPESREWAKSLGADHVIPHQDLAAQVRALGLPNIDFIFSTTHTAQHWPQIAEIIAPFGEVGLIDDAAGLDLSALKPKSVSLHWELMFTKSMFDYRVSSQGEILEEIKELIESGRMKTTVNRVLEGLATANIREGHTLLENHTNIGKVVVRL